MAQALAIPVVGIGSLDLIAYPLRHTRREVVAIIDARRKEVFWARYRPVHGGLAYRQWTYIPAERRDYKVVVLVPPSPALG